MALLANTRTAINRAIQATTATCRHVHATCTLLGAPIGDDEVRNFNRFTWPNKVGTFEHHRNPKELLENEYNYPVWRDTMGIRYPGYWFKKKFVHVPEMEPELIVPDLTGCELKPYVSYTTNDVFQSEFTAKDLFNAVYAEEIINEFREGKEPKTDVTEEEIDASRLKALQTGADMFEEFTYDGVRARD